MADSDHSDFLDVGISCLPLQPRLQSRLERAGIITFRQLLSKSLSQLASIDDVGYVSAYAILKALISHGFVRSDVEIRPGSEDPIRVLFSKYVSKKKPPDDPSNGIRKVSEGKRLVSYREANRRAVRELKILRGHLNEDDPARDMLDWIVYYLSTREEDVHDV